MIRGAALNGVSTYHLLDHLGIISVIMGIPYLMHDPEQFELAQKYYPEIQAELKEPRTLTPSYLFQHFDALFLSEYYASGGIKAHFEPMEELFDKKMRVVHCPHGFSDKSYFLKLCAYEEISLIYGQHMLDMLKDCGVLEALKCYVISGNYRYTYYKKHQEFYRQIVETEVLSRFQKQQQVILYAPTWNDEMQASTFLEAAHHVIGGMPDHYNMIVKLHPHLEINDIATLYQVMSRYEDKSNVLFLTRFPIVYPLLAYSDLYIGDASAVGYDFLAFNKPMFFMSRGITHPLYRCGVEVLPTEYSEIYPIIEKSRALEPALKKVREEMYQYTFGKEKSFLQLKEEILKVL